MTRTWSNCMASRIVGGVPWGCVCSQSLPMALFGAAADGAPSALPPPPCAPGASEVGTSVGDGSEAAPSAAAEAAVAVVPVAVAVSSPAATSSASSSPASEVFARLAVNLSNLNC